MIYVIMKDYGYEGLRPISAFTNYRSASAACGALDAVYERYKVFVADKIGVLTEMKEPPLPVAHAEARDEDAK